MRKSPIGSGQWVILRAEGADLPGWVEAPLYGFGNGGWPADTVA